MAGVVARDAGVGTQALADGADAGGGECRSGGGGGRESRLVARRLVSDTVEGTCMWMA